MAGVADPFYHVKDEVLSAVDSVSNMYDKWKDLLDNHNTAETDEFRETTNDLSKAMNMMDVDLDALAETVSIVEMTNNECKRNGKPPKFNLPDDELASRKRFIKDIRNRIKEIREELTSPQTRNKIERDRRAVLLSNQPELDSARDLRGDLMIEQEKEEQELLIREQDDIMDDIAEDVGRLHEVSLQMNAEMKDQTKILEDVNKDMTNLSGRVKAANNKLTELIETTLSTKQKLCLIVFLMITFVVLLFLTIYT